MKPQTRLLAILLVASSLMLIHCTVILAQDGPSRSELTSAEHFLEKFERHVERMSGKPFDPSYDDNEALRRITELMQAYPDDPEVQALVERVRAALMASKGEYFEITEDMLRYRQNEQILMERVGAVADEQWQGRLAAIAQDAEVISDAFPCPDPLEVSPEEVIGKYVVLEDFLYPDNEFTDMGGQYVFVGSGAQGYYFVKLSSRSWLGAYEALKRYRRQVSQETAGPWTVVGKIVSVSMLIPEAGQEPTTPPALGWIVVPECIYLPNTVLSWADPELETGGEFAGEATLQDIRWDMFTYTEVPDDVDPMQLVTIFATAIKEKNWDLFLECIDPARQTTPTAIKRLLYFYDNNLERYRRWYVHVQPTELKEIEVIKGVVIQEGSYEDLLLSPDQKELIASRDQEVVEEVHVVIKTYDENGKQFALPKDVVLRRYNGGRWYIASGYPL